MTEETGALTLTDRKTGLLPASPPCPLMCLLRETGFCYWKAARDDKRKRKKEILLLLLVCFSQTEVQKQPIFTAIPLETTVR